MPLTSFNHYDNVVYIFYPVVEKQFNAMIGKGVDKEEFVRRVNAMDLSLPAKIHVGIRRTQHNFGICKFLLQRT
jgi:hypothetical protein